MTKLEERHKERKLKQKIRHLYEKGLDETSIAFRCNCSIAKVADALLYDGRRHRNSVLVRYDCEICGGVATEIFKNQRICRECLCPPMSRQAIEEFSRPQSNMGMIITSRSDRRNV